MLWEILSFIKIRGECYIKYNGSVFSKYCFRSSYSLFFSVKYSIGTVKPFSDVIVSEKLT